MNRRSYLASAGIVASTLLAGCTEQFTDSSSDGSSSDDGNDDSDDSGSDTGTDSDDGGSDTGAGSDDGDGDQGTDTPENGDPSEDSQSDDQENRTDEQDSDADDDGSDLDLSTPASAIEAYVEAAGAGDEDALASVIHSAGPIHPDNWEDVEVDYGPFDAVNPADVDTEVVTEDATGEDVRDLEGAELWFEDVDLDDRFGDSEVRIVGVETGDESADAEFDRWVLVSDDEDWRVLFIGTTDDTPEDPETLFEEPIEDSANDVVADVEWDVEPTSDTLDDDASFVEVTFTESPGIDAHTVRIETTIAGGNLELYNDQDGEAEVTWAGNAGTIEFDSEGDQLEVVAVTDDGEEVVHREHYEP